MLKTFIERPVLSTVISILITILGILGLMSLPIEQYPEIAPPTVQVTSTYTGANAGTVLNSVIVPLEEEINGVEGMTYMTSTASNDGVGTINVFFELGVDPDIAAVNVQNRVARATSKLPEAVVQTGVTTAKTQTSALMFLSLYSTNKEFDGTFVQNFANINLVPKLKRVKGVGQVTVFGGKDYSMRIWIDPEKMAAYNLTPADIQNALREQNVEAAPGKFGENADGIYEYVIKYKGRLNQVEEYENIVIKATGNGNFLHLKDVANIELGAFNYGQKNYGMGNEGVAMGIFQTSGSNANDIIDEVLSILEEEKASFPKGIEYVIPFNTKTFLDASIEKVIHTLIEAFILVFIVVYLFLQDFRSTLIPAIAVPVAIIGTFFFLNLFGFSINLLTLFAVVLAIGIVVDDAIVVVEAVHAKLDEGEKSAKKATLSAMNEITGAIVSITLVMSAVFIPVSFLQGPSGVFYQQFAITLAIAILISALNALTLSPALCALLLKPHDDDHSKKKNIKDRFFDAFNVGFNAMNQKYTGSLRVLAKRKWITVVALVVFSGITYYLFTTTPSGFIPNEDRGIIMADITLPPGTTLEKTEESVKQLDSILQSMPMVEARMNIVGFSLLNRINGGSYAFTVIRLKDWSERTEPNQTVDAIVGELFAKTAGFKDARMLFFTPPSVQGFGNADGFEFKIEDKGDDDWATVSKVSNEFLAALSQRPEVQYAITNFNPNFPQYQMDINVERAKDASVSVSDIFNTMQGYYGGLYTTDFNRFGKQFRVMIQAKPENRADERSINDVYVRNASGEMVAISQFVDFKKIYGPEAVSRFNLLKAVNVNGKANPGYSSGDAIKAIQEVAAEHLPSSYTYEFSGMTREEILAGNQAAGVFLLSLIFVYFLLSAQYESYVLPLSVLLSLPVGIAGAIGFVKLAGLENNIYFQVALIMLIGLLAKNAILIVEFAVQRRRHGMSLTQSAIEGAKARLRPILMTSFAFILGLLPLALATGVGAVGNRSIGMGAVGGMLVGTVFGVFVIPILFVIFQGLQERISGKPEEKEETENTVA
ncbi:hydrophobe/amphiphile efflux-1 family RND transporter [Flavobacterium arcticum]|uniref:Hydrophobe/amphiphile efflux-1 family RND transporter n=1 Tax=Flavobacterium arcticum TaxID=1784713 RepID=A0A345HBM8_9FLAO|nr:efflux RND transporter permease subunit [Flavobacterium arcticum]AXG73988.1 hydrophobe/amphiphile efflux-1 family RND transporter [Flavobacterium arcticum]KAF2508966.1 efflux RND transporter permease subunit [Flavobacterium arcticum]